MDPVTQAKELLKKRVEEIDKERGPIVEALNALSPGNGTVKVQRRSRRQTPVQGGKRGQQALRLIRANPGIKIPELAKKMKLKNPNYLYRVIPSLPVVKAEDGGFSVKPDVG